MSRIGIVIDPHITDRHRCRKDNFLDTVLEKLDYIASNNDYVVVAGDLFHTSSNLHQVLYKTYTLLAKHRGKFIVIPGNHDLMNNNLNVLERTTIGILSLTGALSLMTGPFSIDNAHFVVSHVMKNLDNIPVDETNNKILLGHNYVEMVGCPKESFTKDELKALNYGLVFLGHEHKPYEEELLGESVLIRMGSLTRIDTQKYNKEREIFYYQLDSETLEYEKLPVPHKPAEEVYVDGAFDKVETPKETFFIKLGDVLAKFKKKSSEALSLNARLSKVASQKEVDYIKSLYDMNSVRYF